MLAAVIVVLLVIAFGFFAFFGAGGGSTGPWGMGPWMMGPMAFFWIFPIIGLLIFLTLMFFFINMIFGRGGGSMDWMWRKGPRDNPPPSELTVKHCPSCNSVVQPGWIVCPHCGADLKS